MTTIEAPIPVSILNEDIQEVDDFICHLYIVGTSTAFCGLSEMADVHSGMHRSYKQALPNWNLGEEVCALCGTPICKTCLAEAQKHVLKNQENS